MATEFPTDLDSFVNPAPDDTMLEVPHDEQHANINDAVEAIQAKLGIDNSGVESSIEYILKNALSIDPGHKHTAASIVGGVGSGSSSYIDPHDYGAVGDALAAADGTASGTSFTSAGYAFQSGDVGKTIYVVDEARTIASVSSGTATLSSAVTSGSNRRWLMGTDDTQAFEDAFEAARPKVESNDGSTSETGAWASIPVGGTVMLRSGKGYLIKNTSTRFGAGKLGAITIPRRCGLRGAGMGQSHLYLAPGNYGHGIANENADVSGGGWDDFMQLQDFSLFCNHALQTSDCLDGIHFKAAFNNYLKVDNFMVMSNIRVFEPRRNGFHIQGRGEAVYFNLFVYSSFNYGFNITDTMDSRFYSINAGGCQKTGIRITKAANCHFTNCKSFYSGSAGATDYKDSANWALTGDSYAAGQCVFTGCEGQESRGSSIVIENGMNQFSNCLFADPKRDGLTSGTLPNVCAGIHLAKYNTAHWNAKYNIFSNCYVRPAVAINYEDLSATMPCGTHAVYIEDSCAGNVGQIYTFPLNSYTVAKIGGTGTTNGLNTGLRIDSTYIGGNIIDGGTE